MNMLQAALGIGCVVLAGALWSSCSSASAERATLESSMTKLSNDWSQAVLKLNEQSALAFTLQTQLRLVQEEHHKTTNGLPSILAQLQATTTSNALLIETSRAISNRLQLQVLELQDEYADATQHVANAALARTEAEKRAQSSSSDLTNAWRQSIHWSNQLHQTRLQMAALESSLRDPSMLKAQLDSLLQAQASRSSSSAPGSNTVSPLRIQLNSNGFVETLPPH